MRDIGEVTTEGVRDILNAINAGIYITDRDRKILFWNRQAEKITGYRASAVVKRRCADGILQHNDKDGRPLCSTELCPLERSMATGKPTESPVVVYALSARGVRIPLSTMCAPIHDEEGNVIGGVEIFRDSTQELRDMELARVAQRQMLNFELPQDERISFDLHYAPLAMIGGDFFHVRKVSDDVFAVLLADVAGHGISSALYTALLHSLVDECAGAMDDAAAFLTAVNVRICTRVPNIGFITALAANFDAATHAVRYCCAGHPGPLLQSPSGDVVQLESTHYPLGVQMDSEYENTETKMEKGQRLLAYTDGAVEIRIDKERRLNVAGLISLVEALPPKGGEHRLGTLYGNLIQRSISPIPEDDITLLSCMLL